MQIILNNSSMIPVYEQLMDQIKSAIIKGELKCEDPLPSVRGLSAELKISALTVKKAYDRLEEEGFVVTIHGKGTYVAQTDEALVLEARKRTIEEELARVIEHARAIGMTSEEIMETLKFMLEE